MPTWISRLWWSLLGLFGVRQKPKKGIPKKFIKESSKNGFEKFSDYCRILTRELECTIELEYKIGNATLFSYHPPPHGFVHAQIVWHLKECADHIEHFVDKKIDQEFFKKFVRNAIDFMADMEVAIGGITYIEYSTDGTLIVETARKKKTAFLITHVPQCAFANSLLIIAFQLTNVPVSPSRPMIPTGR